MSLNPLALMAPLFLVFEVWQLVISERYMGVKQIRVNADPRTLPMAGWLNGISPPTQSCGQQKAASTIAGNRRSTSPPMGKLAI